MTINHTFQGKERERRDAQQLQHKIIANKRSDNFNNENTKQRNVIGLAEIDMDIVGRSNY